MMRTATTTTSTQRLPMGIETRQQNWCTRTRDDTRELETNSTREDEERQHGARHGYLIFHHHHHFNMSDASAIILIHPNTSTISSQREGLVTRLRLEPLVCFFFLFLFYCSNIYLTWTRQSRLYVWHNHHHRSTQQRRTGRRALVRLFYIYYMYFILCLITIK